MSDTIAEAVRALNTRLAGGDLDGSAKFVIPGEGAIVVDALGAKAGDAPADVTLTASAETFRAVVSGDLDPASAFMSGKLEIEGDMAMALKLAGALADHQD